MSTSLLPLADLKQTLNVSARAVMERHVKVRMREPRDHREEAFVCDCKYGRALRRLLSMYRAEGA